MQGPPIPDAQESRIVTDWDRIVREYGPLVFATAWRILGHTADTEDIVQEVFLQVHQMQQTDVVRHWPGLLRRLAACRALDRVLRAGYYWVPQWYRDVHPIAYWDVFSRPAGYPATYPRYDRGDRAIPETWWYDPARAAKTVRAG